VTPQDLIAAFDTLAEAPEGVRRLRELVLQLAVRGKLVPQDPADEPASVLLDGRTLNPADEPFDLAVGWAWSSIATLGEIRGGGTPSKRNSAFWGGQVPWVSPKDMKRDLIGESRDYVTDAAVAGSSVKRIPPGSVLMVVRGMILAHSFPTALTTAEVTINQDMKALLPFDGRLAPYLLLATKGHKHDVLNLVERSTHGTCKLPTKSLFPMPMGIPPLAEQHRIVARVDELMGLLDRLEAARTARDTTRAAARDAALAALREADTPEEVEVAWNRFAERMDDLLCDPADIDPLRQAVLQLAVRGKLVPQDPEDEPASVLLERTRDERLAAIKAKRVRKRPPPSAVEVSPYGLPPGWVWCRLGDVLLDIQAGKSPSALKRPKQENEWGVLKVSACSWGRFLPYENKALPADIDPVIDCEVHVGDFLISRANTQELVARSVVVERTPPRLMLSDKTLRVRPATGPSVRYLNLANLSVASREHYEAEATGTSASMRNVGQGAIWNAPVALPPLAEQHRIVARVDELMGLLDRLETRLIVAQTNHASFASAAVHHLDA